MKQNKEFTIKIKIKLFLSFAWQISPEPTIILCSPLKTYWAPLRFTSADLLCPFPPFLLSYYYIGITFLHKKIHSPMKIKEKKGLER